MRGQLIVLGVALFAGHGGQPLTTNHGGAGPVPAPRGGAAIADATRFLAAARGVDPVICSLAAAPLGNRWGGGAPPAVGGPDAALVAWALKPTIAERDLTLLERGLTDDDGCVRAMSARLLAGADGGPAILVRALGAERPTTRRVAAEGLGFAEDRSATAALIRRIEDDDADVRAAAAWALGRIEDPSAEEALAGALRDGAPTVRIAAIEALGALELDSSIDLLLPMLLDDEPRARAAAARALGELH